MNSKKKRRPFSAHRWRKFIAALAITAFLLKNLMLSASIVSYLPKRQPSVPLKTQITELRKKVELSKRPPRQMREISEPERGMLPQLDSWANFLP